MADPSSRTDQGSWFGSLDEDSTGIWPHSVQTPAPGPADAAARPGTALNAASWPSFHRILRAFLTARVAVSIVLATLMLISGFMGSAPPGWLLALAATHALMAMAAWSWPAMRQPRPGDDAALSASQALATIGVDLGIFALLHHLTGPNLNSQALLVLPVLMAAVLLRRGMALGVVATAAITLLSAAWVQGQGQAQPAAMLIQAGLTGFGLFVIALLASELSTRLAREERSARGSLEMARQQARLNRLVIEEMSDGVMVVDRQGRVRTANPAARRLLAAQGMTEPAPFRLRGVPAWAPLTMAIDRGASERRTEDDGQELALRFDDQSVRNLRVRLRFTRGHDERHAEAMCVVLLEDLRTVRARERQAKLAAMGRMSAGIAHEIRNPLAAIAQANALLEEDPLSPTQRRLTGMIAANVARLKHIVNDILAVAPGVRPPAPLIEPVAQVVAICNEWRGMHGLGQGEDSLLEVDLGNTPQVMAQRAIRARFEPEHLHRVLVNLLDNALRYHSGHPGALLVSLRWLPGHAGHDLLMVSVSNDGEAIAPEHERALFEPFFSTSSRGTGLGLYICRELCERHGASIDYRQHPPSVRHRNEFFLTLPVEPAPPATDP
ncbi:PAS domain-containing protein [Aquabacterium fontiphilum]|uniref:sensor histidine kinase n=1 Tax=Aquabacterium fontiphilum TaxID=450365 RepID=UPI00137773AD|nr:ATP-binding protein [Aquabacterium fontiphilum]NBD20910.1 PAS domain-containing protein [Aquabacterium fontiphilum]